jgi:hypothetical protein
MKKYYIESRRKEISYMKYKRQRLIGLVTSSVETSLQNAFLKERERGRRVKVKVR